MKNNGSNQINRIETRQPVLGYENTTYQRNASTRMKRFVAPYRNPAKSEILVITSYPPRECGIATYSQDLIKALDEKFSSSLSIRVCALEAGEMDNEYPPEVKYKLNTSHRASFMKLAGKINEDEQLQLILVQHEFGLYRENEDAFLDLLYEITKPVVLVFHTVLPNPDKQLKLKVKNLVSACRGIVVMTHDSADILVNEYGVSKQKISVIPHGTHLVAQQDKNSLKIKYGLKNRKVL
ncbi:MAG TPA: glycosyltransferase, partial [Paludibacter sp.]|nr:glycosyltransferase [Paludibacter sp.]